MATCIVRIYLPLKNDLTPNKDSEGHYDVQVLGTISLSIPVDGASGKTYTNPIVSYGSKGLFIYNNGGYILRDKWMLCTIAYDNAFLGFFESWLNQFCEFNKHENSDEGIRDVFNVSGEYEVYSKQTHSCFAAVADWLVAMGDNTLKNIYNAYTYPDGTDSAPAEEGYKNYGAWAMFEKYYRHWNVVQLNPGQQD